MNRPSRREVLGAGAFTFLTGIAAVAIAKPEGVRTIDTLGGDRTEASLTAIHTELIEVDLAQDQLCDAADEHPYASAECKALWAEVYVYTARYHELLAQAAELRPTTNAGMMMKARVAMHHIRADADKDNGNHIAWSFLRDFVGEESSFLGVQES